MLAAGNILDFESLQLQQLQHNNKVSTNGTVPGTDDVLLYRSIDNESTAVVDPEFIKQEYAPQPQRQDVGGSSSASSVVGTCLMVQTNMHQQQHQQQRDINPAQMDYQGHSMSNKELERRQKLRDRKRAQRQNEDFAERERLRARGRIKALREDPVFREVERRKDRERRRNARLINQTQRIQERDRDKIRKARMRSSESKHLKSVSCGGGSYYDTNGHG